MSPQHFEICRQILRTSAALREQRLRDELSEMEQTHERRADNRFTLAILSFAAFGSFVTIAAALLFPTVPPTWDNILFLDTVMFFLALTFCAFMPVCVESHQALCQLDRDLPQKRQQVAAISELQVPETSLATASSFQIDQTPTLHLRLSSGQIYELEDTESVRDLLKIAGLISFDRRVAISDQPALDGQRRLHPSVLS